MSMAEITSSNHSSNTLDNRCSCAYCLTMRHPLDNGYYYCSDCGKTFNCIKKGIEHKKEHGKDTIDY